MNRTAIQAGEHDSPNLVGFLPKTTVNGPT